MTHATRPRNAAATRGALLTAARELFAAGGFERTTVRAVAERAGVNQALLFRYFGNKEALFAEAVTELALRPLREGPPETLLPRILAALLDGDGAPTSMFFAVLRSDGAAAEEVHARVGAAYRDAFAALAARRDPDADPADAHLRADLVMAWLLGLAQLRPGGDGAAAAAHVLRAADALLAG
ncbi:MAG: TetR family transcriptional regulator [Pseudonocardiales bacterium]|jgi:AcrR family transcriptional regulator|nr:TetR family transcriptional regulator [Pseudonocardiales bacterium]